MLKLGYRPILLALAIVLLGNSGVSAASGPNPILVELFTSEGCSDCPPADSFLRQLDGSQPVTGAQLIVLEEHVDYWDDLGWRDPFSSHTFTLRQSEYVDRLRLASAYTPQMVVDGTLQFVGSDRRSAGKALDIERYAPKIAIRISNITLEKGTLRAHVETDAVPAKADVVIALAAEHAESQVARGENGGHHLEHVAVASDLVAIGKADKGQAFSKDITVDAKSFAQPGRVVVFLQEPHQGKILGAVLDRLPSQSATKLNAAVKP